MTQFEFAQEFARLIETFGARAFPEERNKLIWKQVSDMDIVWFKTLCDRMIGDMRQPPMVPDFREAAYKERQARFSRDIEGASKSWDAGEFNGLQGYLDSIGATSLANAVEQERWRLKNGQDDFPDSAWPRIINEASKIPADQQRQLASMIKDLTNSKEMK